MKRVIIGLGWLMAACVAVAGTGTSNEFRVDTRTGVRTAAATERIQYSTAWGGDTEDATHEIKAVVKVNPCLKTPPKYLVVDMSGGRSAARWPISYLDEVPSGGWTDEYKTEKLVLRYIPAGSFIMGGRATDYPGAVNTNLHMVTLTKPFYIGVFECTQRQWELAMGTRPSFFTNETCYATRPVEGVCYMDIRGGANGMLWPEVRKVDDGSFMKVLADKTAIGGFDLPTEAQWEYACRAGTTTALNNGLNITGEACLNVDMVARNKMNSSSQIASNVTTSNVDCASGTAKVGSYLPNGWGLYDMHGNVWEQNIDSFTWMEQGAIDPIGNVTNSIYHQIKGGAYSSKIYMLSAGDHHDNGKFQGNRNTWRANDVGFRICLHDATVYPSADLVTVLVNAAGAGAADWTPTQVGTYQLTHEVQVDGTTVAPMESALFRVEGPELNIRPQGELTNGVLVKVEKVGGGGQWNIYYSLDGSTPTAGSTKYEGPFALEESATVKAVAISPSGVSSEVASKELALSPALAVEDVAARQRYPWNGKVDIDCEITGDATKKYAVTFSVEDEIGHTNLTIKTLSLHCPPPPLTSTSRILPPGHYRFTWDAAADLPKGTRFGGVSVSIDAEPSPLADWKRVVTISTDGYAGNETLTDVPVLVRLSSAIEGFDYADFSAPDTGADMIFTDMEGVARYPYEIDEWHKDGESLIWVKLPELRKGTKLRLAYGNAETGNREQGIGNSEDRKHEVWREYAGVWHMNEDSGTAFDSTEHGLDALPGGGMRCDVSRMVAVDSGACGRARDNGASVETGSNSMIVPSFDALCMRGEFVASGWFKVDTVHPNTYPILLVRNNETPGANSWADGKGWGVEFCKGLDSMAVYGGSNSTYLKWNVGVQSSEWESYVFVYSNELVTCYLKGAYSTNFVGIAAQDNGAPMDIGGWPYGNGWSLNGQYDEIRLRGGSLSADRIKADYDMIANRDFCTYGKVEGGVGK